MNILNKSKEPIHFDMEVLNSQIVSLQSMLNTIGFEKVVEKLGMKKVEKTSIKKHDVKGLTRYEGIYIFYITLDSEEKLGKFQMDWNKYKEIPNIKIPKLNKDVKSSGNSEYVLYLGKAEKCLKTRINNHLGLSTAVPYALKWSSFHKKSKYEISYECYYFNKDSHLDIFTRNTLLRIIEKHMHNEMKPLLGTSAG